MSRALFCLFLLTVAFISYAALDIAALEWLMKPAARALGNGEDLSFFNHTYWGFTMLAWHWVYLPAGFVLLGYSGWAVDRWRGVVSAWALFCLGYEDWWYYLLQCQGPPRELPWLDPQPMMSWSRWVTGTDHVTNVGITITTLMGLTMALWLMRERKKSPE